MLTVGNLLPEFRLRPRGGASDALTRDSFPGQWLVLLYWPVDFAFVCASETRELRRRGSDIMAKGAQVIGVGHNLAWERWPPDAEEPVPFPLLDDSDRTLARVLGLRQGGDACALRATFIADPSRVIRWVRVSDISVGRSVTEAVWALSGLRNPEKALGALAGAGAAEGDALIPMCAWCKKVRSEAGDWTDVEEYIHRRTGGETTHGICPECFRRQTP